MSRVGPARGGPLARFAAWYARRSLGKTPAAIGVTAHSRWVTRGYLGFELGLERAGALDRRLLELAQLKAASVVGCEYCLDIGTALARATGTTAEQVAEIHRHAESEHFSDADKLLLDYAAAMSRTPVAVTDELFDELRKHFGDAELIELTAAIAWENYRARFNWALDLEPQGFTRGGACALPGVE